MASNELIGNSLHINSQQSCRYSADTERLAASAERPITVPPGLDRLPVTCRWPANRQPAGRKPGDGAKAERPPNGLRCGRRRTVIAGPRQRGPGRARATATERPHHGGAAAAGSAARWPSCMVNGLAVAYCVVPLPAGPDTLRRRAGRCKAAAQPRASGDRPGASPVHAGAEMRGMRCAM
jgi:hypothetical protein